MHRPRLLRSAGAVLLATAAVLLPALVQASTPAALPNWSQFGGSAARTFFNPSESLISAATVKQLVPKWRFPTVEPVSASTAVATVNGTQTVFDADYAGNLYAVDAASGLPVWERCLPAAAPALYGGGGQLGSSVVQQVVSTVPGGSPGEPPAPICALAYPYNGGMQTDYAVAVASPSVATVGTRQLVYEAADAQMYALDAATGNVVWSFNAAGTSGYPNYEIEASPLVLPDTTGPFPAPSGQVTVFSIDCNGIFSKGDLCAKPGGIWAVDAASGALVWFFDPASGKSYGPGTTVTFNTLTPYAAATPNSSACGGATYCFGPSDDVPFGAPSTGNGPTSSSPCAGIWASQSADLSVSPPLIFAGTSDCPNTASTDPKSPYPTGDPFYEAFFALNLQTGAAAWTYQPRQHFDGADLDYGATPNVFTLAGRDVVGIGSKDGTYELASAVNSGCATDPVSGAALISDANKGQPCNLIWQTKLSLGGNFGGFYAGTTDGSQIYLTTALGTASGTGVTPVNDASSGRVFALDATNGALTWVQVVGAPTLGPDAAIPGVYFTSGLDHAVHAYDTTTGSLLAVLPTGGATSSTPVVVGGQLFVGAGTGATWRSAIGTCLDPINPLGECSNPTTAPVLTAPAPMPIYEDGQGIWAFCLGTDPACYSSRVTTGALAPPTG